MPTLDRAELEDVRLYLDLAWRLGMIHAQMDRGTLKNARLIYRGEVAHKNTKLITASFAAGLMEAALEQPVNLVNALSLARERGLEIEERAAEAPGDFGTMIQSEVTTERKTYVAAGHPLRQAVSAPGASGFLPARRPHGRQPARLHSSWTARA